MFKQIYLKYEIKIVVGQDNSEIKFKNVLNNESFYLRELLVTVIPMVVVISEVMHGVLQWMLVVYTGQG